MPHHVLQKPIPRCFQGLFRPLFLQPIGCATIHAAKCACAKQRNDCRTTVRKRGNAKRLRVLVTALFMQNRAMTKRAVHVLPQDKPRPPPKRKKKQPAECQPAMHGIPEAPKHESARKKQGDTQPRNGQQERHRKQPSWTRMLTRPANTIDLDRFGISSLKGSLHSRNYKPA